MSLSNTATPKYYGKFRDAVLAGEIPVNEEIAMEMVRIDDLIADPDVYYDPEATERYIRFCENELVLTDGSDLHLLDTFKLWAEQIFCWYVFDEEQVPIPKEGGGFEYKRKRRKRRLRNKQYLIIARGAAKSMYGSTIQNFYLNCDPSTTYQITTSPTMRQSAEIVSPIKTAITRSRGPYYKFLTYGSLNNTTGNKAMRQKLASTKKGIENFINGSWLEIRPMSIDSLQGMRCKVATLDEWLSCEIREDPIGAIEQGASKIPGYLIVAMSSEGTIRNGVGDSMKMELMSILRGEYKAPEVSIFYYRLDSIDEVADPSKWIKANPNIGLTVSYDAYARDVERAEKVPSARNDILAKRFNIPMEGYTYFFTYDETLPVKRKQYFKGMPCALGADLSRGDDFCAFTFLFPRTDGTFGVLSRSYITTRTMNRLPIAMHDKYMEFIKEGSLVIMEGTVLDLTLVYDDLDDYIVKQDYDVRAFGYDPYNAAAFVERWCSENSPYGVVKVIQGAKTESVPLGEIKQLAEDAALVFDQQAMKYAMGNCIVIEDTNGNRKLAKPRHDKKIDPVAALLDAYVAYKDNRDSFD